jgi:DNA-binding transcriptional ArsR family regulator
MKSRVAAPERGAMGYSSCMDRPQVLTDRARERVAARFKALGEPTRLKILERLFQAPASVGEIQEAVDGTQANISKHLAVLRAGGLLRRRRDGNRIVYAIADPTLERICAIVCDAVAREASNEMKEIGPPIARRARRR